jgi:glutaredoxin-dependent peroxiredoxin
MKAQVGQQAPDFKLFNTQKKTISLQEQQGRHTLLLFFPLAFTSTCTAELCSTRDELKMYNDLNTNVFGISADSLFVLAKFKESLELNFELLSDFNKNVSEDYNTLYPEFIYGMKGVTKRSAFVVDKNGIIRYAEVLENASEQPNFEKIKACLQQLN